MYKNKAEDGKNNVCGHKVKTLPTNLPKKASQRQLADIELKVIARVLAVDYGTLLYD